MNSLRANTRTFTATGAAAGNVESTDDMIHLLFNLVGIRLPCYRSIGLIKNALLTAARRANIAAGIAADTLGQLALPESKTLFGAHCFNLLDLGEFITGKLRYRQRLSQLLVCNFISSALAHQAFVQQHVSLCQTLFAIGSVDNDLVTVYAHADNTLSAGSLNLVDIKHPAAGSADGVNKLTLNTVILQQLVYSVCITGL